jgi:methenyltetrahydrofolate cyclohydrolase
MEGGDLIVREHLFVRERGHATEDYDPAVSGLGQQSLASFLDDVAAATPAPGGGTSAAFALALGAALVEMAASLAGDSEAASRSRGLRAEALELAERELSSYAPVLEATRLPRDDPSRADRLEEALVAASRTPLAIAERAASAADLGAAVVRASSPRVRGDALTGLLLAEAAAAAAATLVEINLERQPAAPELEHARAARERAARARAEAEGR